MKKIISSTRQFFKVFLENVLFVQTLYSIMQKMTNVNKPQQKFLAQLFTALATFVGKATYRNLNRYSNLNEKAISRWFRRVFDFLQFNNLLLHQLITSKDKISAIDASYMKKIR